MITLAERDTPEVETLFSETPSEVAKTLVKELLELCVKHDVCLSTSGYDGLRIWKANPDEPVATRWLYAAGIKDVTL